MSAPYGEGTLSADGHAFPQRKCHHPLSTALVPGQRSTSWEHFCVITLPTCDTLNLCDSNHFYTWPRHSDAGWIHTVLSIGFSLGRRTIKVPWMTLTQRALRSYALKHPFAGERLQICVHRDWRSSGHRPKYPRICRNLSTERWALMFWGYHVKLRLCSRKKGLVE